MEQPVAIFLVVVMTIVLCSLMATADDNTQPAEAPAEAPVTTTERLMPYSYYIKDMRVIDGDTVECQLDLGFDIQKKISVRIRGINTPEKRGDEKIAGIPVTLVARNYLESLGRPLVAHSYDWGKYAGRCLGDIQDADGKNLSLSVYLAANGFAKVYEDQSGKRTTFSKEELLDIRQKCHDELHPQFEPFLEELDEVFDHPEDRLMIDFGLEFGYLEEVEPGRYRQVADE